MSAKASSFKETDVKRGVRAVQNAGLAVDRVEFGKDGKFSVVTREPAETDEKTPEKVPTGTKPEPWD